MMSLQGKGLQRLCQSLWRVRGNNLLGAWRSDCLQRLSCSLPEHLLLWPSHPASSSLPSFLAEDTGISVDFSEKPKDTSCQEEVGRKLQKGARNGLEICSTLSGLSLHSRGVTLAERKWDLASWPHRNHVEYVCPSEKLSTLPQLVILDHLPFQAPYDLPRTSNPLSLIIDPTPGTVEISEPTTTINVPKEAREIMKIRRKKMKRHQLKKFRKRNKFLLRKIRRNQQKKKEALFQERLAGIKAWGDSFNARDWVQEELNKARKGGFYINVLEKRQ